VRLATLVAAAIVLVLLFPVPAETGRRPFAVVDLHVDLPYQSGYEGKPFVEGTGQFRAADLAHAGVVGVVLPLFVPRRVSPVGPRLEDYEASYRRVFSAIAGSEVYRLPGCVPRDGRVGTFLAFEGAGPLAAKQGDLVAWAMRGVRILGLVHTQANELASSSGDAVPKSYGLTAEGREVVRAGASLGMAIDVSHASDRATRDVLSLASELSFPVVATHSNARALADHPRNLRDDELRRVAKSGGVVGVNFYTRFLNPRGRASIADVVRQVRHLSRVMGSEHVAIGSDFEGDIRPATGLSDVSGHRTKSTPETYTERLLALQKK
jgi:membrane dipeptidase